MALLAASLAFGSAACKKEDRGAPAAQETAQAGSAAGSAAESPAAEIPAAADDLQMAKRAGNCPSTVAGATTSAERKDGTIVLTISSDDKDAIAAIQKRTEALLAQKANAAAGAGHDQKGSYGGAAGLCPVHLGEGGTATSKPTEQGVLIEITPKGDPAALQAEIEARIPRAAEWAKQNLGDGDKGTTGGVGGGAGEHGSNHSGQGDGKGAERRGDGTGGGAGTGGGGGAGTGGGGENGGGAAN